MAYFESLEEARNAWEAIAEECVPFGPYPRILRDVKRCGFSTVYDIGSSFGPHVEYALKQNFRYIGIDRRDSPLFWNYRDEFLNMDSLNAEFLFGMEIPFDGFKPERGSCAISICALGSMFEDDDETIGNAMHFLTSHFTHFWCSTFGTSIQKMKKYWKHSEILLVDRQMAVAHFWN